MNIYIYLRNINSKDIYIVLKLQNKLIAIWNKSYGKYKSVASSSFSTALKSGRVMGMITPSAYFRHIYICTYVCNILYII